jgi:GNAT superfamily N-acetyltransferase
MGVAPPARGSGLGRALLGAVMGWARSVGAARVVLAVRDGVPHAASLYESAGFAVTGREGDQTHFAIEMRKASG